jgi:hypothetical protein
MIFVSLQALTKHESVVRLLSVSVCPHNFKCKSKAVLIQNEMQYLLVKDCNCVMKKGPRLLYLEAAIWSFPQSERGSIDAFMPNLLLLR